MAAKTIAMVHLLIGLRPADPVGDHAADDHAGAHDEDEQRGDAGGRAGAIPWARLR